MSAAIGEGLREGPNPVIDTTAGLTSAKRKVKHFPAMPYADVPDFMKRLASSTMSPSGRLAFQLLILTATRTSEVLNARWDKLDLPNRLWNIPAERMKMGEDHKVPLPHQAVAILDQAAQFVAGSELIFPGQTVTKPLSNMVFTTALKRFKELYTAHGFRSSFRDWAEEQTSFPHAVKEAALAHQIKNKVEAAYRRTTLLAKRSEMMAEWAKFILADH